MSQTKLASRIRYMNLLKFLPILMILTSISSHAQSIMTLESFLKKVREQNLDLKIETFKSDAANANSIGLTLPAPMISIDQMKMDSGMTAKGFEVSQSIPFPTKLLSNHSVRKYAAKSQAETRMAREKEILAEARLLYIDLWATQEKLALLKDKKKIIEEHVKLTRSTARSNSFTGIHLIKAESDADLLENDILSQDQMIREKQAEIAVFLNADPNDFKISTEEPPLSSIPQIDSSENSHQLQALKFDLERFKAKESEAKSEWLPDFNLQYKEMEATDSIPRYQQIMVGVTLPFVFFWEPYSALKKASAEKMQAEFEFGKQKKNIDAEKSNLLSRVESIKKQLTILKDKLIPKAEKRMKIARNVSPRDMETLQDKRDTMEAFPDLEMKALDLRLQYEEAIAKLEKFVSKKGYSNE